MCKGKTNNTWSAEENSSVGGGDQYPEEEGKEVVCHAWCGSLHNILGDVLKNVLC